MRWVVLTLALAGCAERVTPVEIPPPPAMAVEACRPPVSIPVREATQAEVEQWWGRDRTSLRECGARQRVLTAWSDGIVEASREQEFSWRRIGLGGG